MTDKKKTTKKADDKAPETPVEDLQHPALEGEPKVEIAKRSNDIDTAETPESSEFVKEFVLPLADYENGDKSEIHAANTVGTRQAMVNQGLRPLDDKVTHSSKKHPDGASVILTYKAKAVPAVIADPEDAVVHVNPADANTEDEARDPQ